jgi:hypothetical protein
MSLNTCFGSLSTIKALTYKQRTNYQQSWTTFQKVELYNSNISTIHGQGNPNPMYYQYPTLQEQTLYKEGAVLFATYLGFTSTVQKN